MQRSNRELWLAFVGVLAITAIYLSVVINQKNAPAASGLFGHSIGVIGFLLMGMTETLYTLRKRSRNARWGRMSYWLQFHIFTGIVGPYMVLLHTSWKFNGLAGITLLLTLVIVASGFIGRYIFTAVPRTSEGDEVTQDELERHAQVIEVELRRWQEGQPEDARLLSGLAASPANGPGAASSLVLGRFVNDWRYRGQWRRIKRKLPASAQARISKLEGLLNQQRELRREIAALALTRRLLSVWHSVHIPIGMALFTLATIHMVAAIYYATLLR
jgi:hypothetical protein